MKPTPNQKYTIRQLFAEMKTKEDFLSLLNYSKEVLYREKMIPFSMKQLNFYGSPKFNIHRFDKKFYHEFEIPKKSGLKRLIHAPTKGLKEFQKALNLILHCVYEPHYAATGFVPDKSIVDNSKPHVGKLYVYNIDLKDFFPSIDASRVWGRLLVTPFNLGTTNERRYIANMIKILCCHYLPAERFVDNVWVTEKRHVLPQGAATSPTLTNAICERLDIRLSGVAKRFGLTYTRYADDITFSSMHNSFPNKEGVAETIFKKGSTFDLELRKVIESQNFHIKENKVRLQKKGYKQEVTGLVVNDKINVPRSYIKDLRHWIYFWERYGYDKAYELFLKKYSNNRGHVKKGKPNMGMVIEGKLLYLKMVKGSEDSTYLGLRERFKTICDENSNDNNKTVNTHIEGLLEEFFLKMDKPIENTNTQKILDLIFEEGLDRAMELYKT
ncbi:reverse transcriptase (RNA-dependent DNA polymerase) [Mariniflexile fucanivorans]|uniref:RNA-directed DNA polymerase n=1 Tax=Mariniflexile fucanivorans TaxID=264023 RepID=A0A4R1RS55_9FLAO|nr:reverse transcriptase domain-containing protein [Mariniflexile fucanivorans]TCL69301.1 reverse transcriptase (RNA-dependent DNA polymerase) [Mariniflexile fucanivorans]